MQLMLSTGAGEIIMAKQYQFKIEGETYHWDEQFITGAQVRQVGPGIPEGMDLQADQPLEQRPHRLLGRKLPIYPLEAVDPRHTFLGHACPRRRKPACGRMQDSNQAKGGFGLNPWLI